MSSAWSITKSVNPPRAVFLDFPLGRTAGKPNNKELQRNIMRDTLAAFANLEQSGQIHTLPYCWSGDFSWKERALRSKPADGQPADARVERSTTPQYQTKEDQDAAENRLAKDGCPDCVFPPEPV